MKLSFWTIIIMAISVAFGILSFAILHQTLPTRKAIDNYTAYREQLETEAAKAPQAKKRVEKAMRDVQQTADKWNAYVAVRTPASSVSEGGINLAVNPYQLTVDTQKFRNSIQAAVNVQVKKGGVTVVSSPNVPGPVDTDDATKLLADFYKYPGLRTPVVIFDFGTITVTGTYQQIMANIKAYKTMPHYLAVTDGLQISGTSPHLTGSYSLSIIGFIRGKDIFPPISASVATPAAGAGAFPGGGPAGRSFPGGGAPGGMPPPPGGDVR